MPLERHKLDDFTRGWFVGNFSPTLISTDAAEVAVQRKRADRDRYERDLDLLTRVRASYQSQAASAGWTLLRGDRPKAEVSADVREAVASKLGLR